MDTTCTFGVDGLRELVGLLGDDGWEVHGPQVRDGAVTTGPLDGVEALPWGWVDEQGPGRSRLTRSGETHCFGVTIGPQTWKPDLLPARVTTVTVRRPTDPAAAEVVADAPEPPKRAFVGVRACELAAIARLDHVLLRGDVPDRDYVARRHSVFVVAVSCTRSAATCFCSSVGTGPAVTDVTGHRDLELTELVRPGADPTYLARARSGAGRSVLDRLHRRHPTMPADPAHLREESAAFARAAAEQVRSVPHDLAGALRAARDSEVWDELGERCLACGNCTAVCPTCFCTRPEDRIDLDGTARRERVWDTCFGIEFSRIGDRPVRSSIRSRYRQWLTHKLDTWHDQFDESGCVGCGRCVTWCPVGIDLTEEVPRLLAGTGAGS